MRNFNAEGIIFLVFMTVMSYTLSAAVNDNGAMEVRKRYKRHTMLDNSKLCKAFGCVNGYCKESEFRKFRIVCECFTGYEGKLCDRLTCPYSCGKHGRCMRKGPVLFCQCDKGFFGPQCNSMMMNKIQLHSHPSMQTVPQPKPMISPMGGHAFTPLRRADGWLPPPSGVSFAKYHSHAVVDMNVKPDICAPGFKCYHGHCDRQAMTYGRFRCLCKPTFTGLFCEKRCTLNCQNGGTCMVMDNGHQFCSCTFNFKGFFCQTPIHFV